MQQQRNPLASARDLRPEAVRAYGTMNTLRALEALASEPYSAAELAERIQIGVRSARRLLRRLQLEGYVVQDDGYRRRFRATLRLAVIGRQLVAQAALPRAAAGWVSRLATATSCTAHLWIPAGDELLCIVHAGPTERATPQPMLGELMVNRDGAAATVLRQRQRRSSAYVAGESAAAAAASVIDGRAVVAALGVTGPCTVEALARVVRASIALSLELNPQPNRRRP